MTLQDYMTLTGWTRHDDGTASLASDPSYRALIRGKALPQRRQRGAF